MTRGDILSGARIDPRHTMLERLSLALALDACHITFEHSAVLRSLTYGNGLFQGRLAPNRIAQDTGLPRERVDEIMSDFRVIIQAGGAIRCTS